ncbi:MAG: tRNA pseudouridine(55) synthase TruB [Kiritimatiellae bacterium]|nr:tRNA pseudouridine(55) synthase TruB [Kiritimatiellia bacterium]
MKSWPNPFQIDGFLLVDKPVGMTSHDVVNRVRKVFQIEKAGHGGTLDPNVSGLLVILLGKATKYFDSMLAKDKRYVGKILLGTETNTQDSEGEIVAQRPYDAVTREDVEKALRNFRGDIFQTPPMVSAVRVNGCRLFHKARMGEDVERKQRFVHVYKLEITEWTPPLFSFEILCTKGTYVRTIAHDLGQLLGCGACLQELRRTQSGPFTTDEAVSYTTLGQWTQSQLQEHVIPIPAALDRLRDCL